MVVREGACTEERGWCDVVVHLNKTRSLAVFVLFLSAPLGVVFLSGCATRRLAFMAFFLG